MKKFLKISLITLLILVILLAGLLFTQTGNNFLKPYLKTELEKQIGLPVKVDTFKLRYDHTVLDVVIDKMLKVDIASDFNLLTQFFDGTYKIYANNFIYKDITLKEANINGEYKGVPDDLRINGKGTSFNAPFNYDLRILNGDAREITFYIKELAVADILALAKQPSLANGILDANLTIPALIKNNLNADIKMNFKNITFNDALMKKTYKISLPEFFKIQGKIDANLSKNQVFGKVNMQSNIANVDLKNVKFNTKTKHVITNYIVNILDLKSLSNLLKIKMEGLLVLKGTVEKSNTLKITGLTDSLGGHLKYTLEEKDFRASILAIPMQNILKMFSFPAFVDSNTSGEIRYNLLSKKGHTKLSLSDFKLAPNDITKTLGTVMPMNPTDIVFGSTSLDANIDGDEIIYSLMAKASKAHIKIGEGRINHKKDIHKAEIEFGFNQYAIEGSIGGSIRKPHIGFDTKGFLKDQMLENDFADKAKDKIKNFFKRLF